jgi:hypothetical protein
MTAILTQMHGNAARTGQFTLDRRPNRVRLIRFPGLTNCRHMIDIYI